jgi:hypothetical protein
VYGVAPPEGVTVADPLLPPKQETGVGVIVRDAAGETVTTTVAVLMQPVAAVPVTV